MELRNFLMTHKPSGLRDGKSEGEAPPPDKVLWHVARIRDYLLQSEFVSNEYFRCERMGEDHIYHSVHVLESWLEEFGFERHDLHAPFIERVRLRLIEEGHRVRAFVWGAGLAVIFFWPEIMKIT